MTTQQEDQDELTRIFKTKVLVVGQNPAMINFGVDPNTTIIQKQLEDARRIARKWRFSSRRTSSLSGISG